MKKTKEQVEVRARRNLFLRWSQADLLRLAKEPVSGYVVEGESGRFAISIARQRLARERVGLLVLARSDGKPEAVWSEGFVASSRTLRPLSEKPRIHARLYEMAKRHAGEQLGNPQHRMVAATEPGQSNGRRSSPAPRAPHRRQ